MPRSADAQSIPARVLTFANVLRGEGVSVKNPITPDQALRFRGVGPKTLPYLEALGLVQLDDFADLPARMGNLLRYVAGFKTRDEVIAAIVTGSFIFDRDTCYYRHGPDKPFRHLRNCGPFTFHQIRAWAGFNATTDDDPFGS